MTSARMARLAMFPSVLVLGVAVTAGVDVETQQAPLQRDFSRELANKMRGTYIIALTAGLSTQDLVGPQVSPALQRILKDAHTAVGHLENYQSERPLAVQAPAREVAKDLAGLGFDLLGAMGSPADAGVREALTQLGVPVAPADRQPVFQHLPSGRAAFINAINPIGLSTTKYVTADQLAQLKAIRDSIVQRRNDPDVARPIGVPEDLPDRVTIFSDTFVVGPVTGEIREELNQADRQANLMAVRATKEFADFVAFSMPMPPTPKPGQGATTRKPHDATVALAHDLVDNGMDVYVGYGNHVVQGIEIYKGRPIFYNLGDLTAHRTDPAEATRTGLIATATYQDGALQEVRIHPVDLGSDFMVRPASTLGIPMTPSASVANRVLAELQKDSEAFGTRIAIENGVGVIRVPREATVAIGQNVREFGTLPQRGGGAAGRGGRGGRGGGF